MRKTFFVSLITLWCAFVYAQPAITNLSLPSSVDVFGLFEMSFQLGKYDNPYDPEVIDVYAEFMAPDGKTFKVNGFYYEGYTFQQKDDYEVASASRDKGWRVRFTPNQAGKWSFSLHAIDRKGKTTLSASDNYPTTFECRSVGSAPGFIRMANTRYLKREVMLNGKSKYQAFYPIGPNVAWYEYKGSSAYPKGIYDYNHYIDKMAGSANYMRIWLTRYQYLSLYGPEFTQMNGKKPTVYFDSSLNQKDAAELDHIIAYAAEKGINVMPCLFSFGDFGNMHQSSCRWDNNPYNTVLGLKSPTMFFTDKEAKRIAKNLVRYIVARWGYATNIVCWELWNEVNNIPSDGQPEASFHANIVKWHEEMADYVRSIDPFKHLVSTSLGPFSEKDYIGGALSTHQAIIRQIRNLSSSLPRQTHLLRRVRFRAIRSPEIPRQRSVWIRHAQLHLGFALFGHDGSRLHLVMELPARQGLASHLCTRVGLQQKLTAPPRLFHPSYHRLNKQELFGMSQRH